MTRLTPEPASTWVVVILTVAALAAATGAVFWLHGPLGMAALVTGAYVLHLIAIRVSATDAAALHSERATREARELEREYERRIVDADLVRSELDAERVRLQNQWDHLRDLVEERKSKMQSVREFERELEAVRKEASESLATARRAAASKEEREKELQARIEELESEQERALERETEMLALTRQIEELESAQEEAERALHEVGSRHPASNHLATAIAAGARSPTSQQLRAWQFISHRQKQTRRSV
jgi:chromosome segregation ATPase